MFRSIPPSGTQIRFKEIFSSLLSKKESGEKFKQKLCEYFQVRDCFLVSSGRAALTHTLKVLKKIRDKDEVIIPAYTCFSVPSAIARAGLKISLCDISLETLDLDKEKLLPLINKNTLAVLPVYHFGLAHNISDIIEHCREQKVFVIEDAAQAMGAKFENKYLGTFGDVGFFSLGRGKNITTIEGGVIISQDEEISFLLHQKFLNFKKNSGFDFFLKTLFYKIFLNPYLYWIPEKIPALELGESKFSLEFALSSLSEYQARLGSYIFQRIEMINQARKKNALYLMSGIRESEKFLFPNSAKDPSSVFLRLPVLVQDNSKRERIFRELKLKGIGVSKMYPYNLSKIPGIEKHRSKVTADISQSESLEKSLLTLPTNPHLRKNDLDQILRVFEKNFNYI